MPLTRWASSVAVLGAISLASAIVLVLRHAGSGYILATITCSWIALFVFLVLMLRNLELRALTSAEQAPTEYQPSAGPKIPTHYAYLNLSLLLLALRELRLRHSTEQGVHVEATVELAYHTDPVGKKVFRAEIRYRYWFEGRQFEGRVVRDYFLNHKAADKLARFRKGEKLTILVNPNRPEISYYPSGFGFVEPIALAPLVLFIAAFLLIMPPLIVWAFTYDLFKE